MNENAEKTSSAPTLPRAAGALAGHPYHPGIHLLAKITAFWSFLVVLLGGLTKSKEAGLTIAEPIYTQFQWDWFFVENLNTEYSHRVFVSILSGLTLGLVALVLLKEERRAVRRLAIGMFFGLLAQAILGAMTVAYFAQAKTSIPHGVLGQLFFCLSAGMVAVTSKSWVGASEKVHSDASPSLKKLAHWTVMALFVQLLLGAALRHDDQAAAMRDGHFGVFIWHLAAHVIGAFTVLYFVSRLLFRVFRDHRHQAEIMNPARLIMLLLGVQFLLGMGAAALKYLTLDEAHSPPPLRVWTATIHLGIGAIIFAASVVLNLRAKHFVVAVSDASAGTNRERVAGVAA